MNSECINSFLEKSSDFSVFNDKNNNNFLTILAKFGKLLFLHKTQYVDDN